MTPAPRYDEPFHWWGPGWKPPVVREITDLLRDGTIDVSMAAFLWAALAHRLSLAVIGRASGIGKTTLLTALIDFLPPDTRKLYLRGCFESFAFLHDPKIEAARTALLVNEISPHLPVYLWGPAVAQMLETRQRGFALLATAHGDSIQSFVASVTGSPLRIPAARIAAFDLVAVLKPSLESGSGRQVREVWQLRATRNGLDVNQVRPELADVGRLEMHLPAATEGQDSPSIEFGERVRLLTDVRDGLIAGLPSSNDLERDSFPGTDGPIDASSPEVRP